jgi:hypothetical protein
MVLVGGGGFVHFGSPWAFTIVLHAEGQWRGNLTTARQCLNLAGSRWRTGSKLAISACVNTAQAPRLYIFSTLQNMCFSTKAPDYSMLTNTSICCRRSIFFYRSSHVEGFTACKLWSFGNGWLAQRSSSSEMGPLPPN